ncbi:hypothetical protein BDR03DRAFT_1014173 [Suillus americanus]|nr:hypothetical protein BDR03DRAFT_1014173 [Suillus americanus]
MGKRTRADSARKANLIKALEKKRKIIDNQNAMAGSPMGLYSPFISQKAMNMLAHSKEWPKFSRSVVLMVPTSFVLHVQASNAIHMLRVVAAGVCCTISSDVHGPAWPESRGFGLASDGFGFEELRARPKPSITAWLWPGSA